MPECVWDVFLENGRGGNDNEMIAWNGMEKIIEKDLENKELIMVI
jgi:hypothetical protein